MERQDGPVKRRLLLWIPVFLLLMSPGCSDRPQVQWTKFSAEKMNEAVQANQPTVLYFYAAWCSACHYMKKNVFTDPRVIEVLDPYMRLKVDASFIHSKKVLDLMQQYNIEGLPTVVVLNGQGAEVFRIRGYADADRVLRHFQHYRTQLV